MPGILAFGGPVRFCKIYLKSIGEEEFVESGNAEDSVIRCPS